MDLEEVKKEFRNIELTDIIESLSETYSVWFHALDKNYSKKQIKDLEVLAQQIAKKDKRFLSFNASQMLGVMTIEFEDRKLTFANGRLIDLKLKGVSNAGTNH